MEVRFIDRPVAPRLDGFRGRLHSAPKVGDVAIEVVNRLDSGLRGSAQQHSERPGKRLDVVGHVSEAVPNQVRGSGLTAKVKYSREGRA